MRGVNLKYTITINVIADEEAQELFQKSFVVSVRPGSFARRHNVIITRALAVFGKGNHECLCKRYASLVEVTNFEQLVRMHSPEVSD